MIEFGIDTILQQQPSWKNKRIGLVTNHAATTNTFIPSRKALLDNGFNIVQLFSPEHGLDVQGADGTFISNGIDALTQLPITSLYGNQLAPTEEDLSSIDVIVFDIPDIGCRFYTYLWTMTHVLEACGKYNKPLIILDRPNPISGNLLLTEVPILDEINCSSFIGRWAMPLRHGCTLGELALYFNQIKSIGANVEVIKCNTWIRTDFQPNWHMKFVATSPAMQTFQAALLYPGLGLLEATNISEGRGTNQAFETAGAPWFKADELCFLFNEMQDEVELQPIQFTPKNSKYNNEFCNGVRFIIKDQLNLFPVFTTLLFIKLVKELHPTFFSWKPYPTLVNPTGKQHLDKLLGITNSEALFDLPMQQFLQKAKQLTHTGDWHTTIQPFLLYS